MNISSLNPNSNTYHHLTASLSEESSNILLRLKSINDSYFFRPDNTLAEKLRRIQPIELSNILQHFFVKIVEEGCVKDPTQFLDRLALVIPLTKM